MIKKNAMFISMQGNWTVKVKSKSAAFPQKFVIIGASQGNGTYTGDVATAPVIVKGSKWSIGIIADTGVGLVGSRMKIKYPQSVGTHYQFDIESDDAGGDGDFNDLILTCSTQLAFNDFLVYGNVTLYSGPCWINPCFLKWIVIDTAEALQNALKIPKLKEAITELYPERIPIINPNPPDPAPYFRPMIINLVDEVQIPPKMARTFKIMNDKELETAGLESFKSNEMSDVLPLTHVKTDQLITAPLQAVKFKYDKTGLAKVVEQYRRLVCPTYAGSGLTLSFFEYDRTVAELAGNPYTGAGHRSALGSTTTDVFGNYIFRFTQSPFERLVEMFTDTALGENMAVQVLPDLIVKIEDLFPVYKVLYESVPYFNIPNVKKIDFCIPKSSVPNNDPFCFNGNLIGSIGNVFIGGNQNKTALFTPAALDRNGFNNHLRSNGVITVNTGHVANPTSLFSVDCACWAGVLDLRGCIYNIATRGKNVPEIQHFTIRYKKNPGDPWQYVTEQYLYPQAHKRNNSAYPNYVGDLVGPFAVNVKEDGGPNKIVPAYINIQREVELLINDWVPDNLGRLLHLNSNIYQGDAPGTVYFRLDGYDGAGNPVPNATDMIALYIDNTRLQFGLTGATFPSDVEYVACGLYKMTNAQLNDAVTLSFMAYDDLSDPANPALGFVDSYSLTFGKCPSPLALDMSTPVVRNNITDGVIAQSPAPVNTNAGGCTGYKGTISDFGSSGLINVTLQPGGGAGWLTAAEEYGVFSFGLTAVRRATNGYNTGFEGNYYGNTSFSIIKK